MGKTAYEEPLGILRRNTDRILRRSIGGRRQAATVADASCCAPPPARTGTSARPIADTDCCDVLKDVRTKRSRIGSGRKRPSSRSRRSSRRASAQSRSAAAQPSVDRHAEAHLGAFDEPARNMLVEQLPGVATSLVLRPQNRKRERKRKADEAMVEQREAGLQADRHRRAVNLYQDVVRQVAHHIEDTSSARHCRGELEAVRVQSASWAAPPPLE